MFVVSMVCWQVEVSAMTWSLVHRSPVDCGASLCVLQKPRERRGSGLLGAVAPNKRGDIREHLRISNTDP
jgi:hypothetical protein